MVARSPATLRCLLAGIAICATVPSQARSDPAMYTGSVHLRLWERAVPYGASLSEPGLANAPSGSPVSLVGTGPAAFTFPPGQLALSTSLVDFSPPIASLDYRRTYFSAANGSGSFFAPGAPGASAFTPLPSIPASQFGVSFSGAPNRFGGVMKLLGSFDWRGELASCTDCSYHTLVPLSAIGGPFGGTAKASLFLGGTASPITFVTATAWGFPWDTGTVGGVARVAGTYSSTTTSAMGTDLRTPSGLGTLQLVTPFLVRVKNHPPACGGCEERYYYAGTARAELHFMPEPAANVLLVAGLGALAVLYRWSRRLEP
jgi:hypothetical protein